MTTTTGDDILAALAAATPRLDAEQREVAVATYRALAMGGPASADAIAAEAGVTPTAATAALESWPGVFRDDRGDVVGFWGLAIPPMAHRLTVAGVRLHTWCAWDPFFIAPLLAPSLGASSVETRDPVTRASITYRVGADGIADLSHPASTISFLIPDGPWGDDVQTTFCHYVHHFAGRDSGKQWVAKHPGTFLLDVQEATDLGAQHARMRFGAV